MAKYFDGTTIILDNKNTLTFPSASSIVQTIIDNNSTGVKTTNYEVNITASVPTPTLSQVLTAGNKTGEQDIISDDGGVSGSVVCNSAGSGFYSGFYSYGMHVDPTGQLNGIANNTLFLSTYSWETKVYDGIHNTDYTMDLSGSTASYTDGTHISSYSLNASGAQIITTEKAQISATEIDFQDTTLANVAYLDTINKQFFIGTPSSYNTGFTAAPLVITGNERYFFEGLLQNTQKGTSSSTDWIVSNDADDGTVATGHYGDLGINSSVYSDPTFAGLGGANGVYLYANGGTLSFATAKSYDMIWASGGTTASDKKMSLAWATPTLKLGSTTTTGIYQILSANTKILSITASATALSNWNLTLPNDVPASAGYMLTSDVSGKTQWTAPPTGTVTSVAMTVPTGLSISGTPITTSGTLALTLTSGYVIPTTTEETNWNTAYTNRITSLTTTGSSGSATLVSNTLNIPTYTLAGLGGISAVTGTTNRITVTGGTAIDIASTYVGQNSITTLGTITTGVWNGTAIANANLANSAITINGTSVSLGGTRTLALASADFANNGTTTTVLIGNGAGNPSFGQVNLTSMVTGVLPTANGGMDTSTYYTLQQVQCSIIAAQAANTYMLVQGSGAGIASGGSSATIPGLIYINSADYPTVNGLAPKLRIRAFVKTNNVAPTGNFTFGLYAITPGAGGTGLSINTIGSLVSGSATSTVTTPAGSTNTQVSSSDFALPANGIYCICVVTTASMATSSMTFFSGTLQIHNA